MAGGILLSPGLRAATVPAISHYSDLHQIDRANVSQLREAWRYDSGDSTPNSQLECTPLAVGRDLFVTTPQLRVACLDAATGKPRWTFNPNGDLDRTGRVEAVNRGLTYWASDPDRRIFVACRHRLWALDAATGQPKADFGQEGWVDLRTGLGREPASVVITSTSPGVVFGDLLIIGSTVPEDLPAAPGDIRAYDTRTGKMRWIFHTIPHPGEFGYDTWPKDAWKTSGGVNCWGGMTLDERRGMVFAALGSPSFDFYGADRLGDDLFGNCVVALQAATGKLVWHFQSVRHDLWDRDLPAPPALVTVQRGGRQIDAVAQTSKAGFTFVLDRDTGKPVFPIAEREVPPTDVAGERTAATQPIPVLPEPFERQRFTEQMVTRRTPEAHAAVLSQLRSLRDEGPFTPPSAQGTLVFPGLDGGGEWGGGAFDPEHHVFYVNADCMVSIIKLGDRYRITAEATGRTLYFQACAGCHGADRQGQPPHMPSLVGIADRRTDAQIAAQISRGGGLMPPFGSFGAPAVHALTEYIRHGEELPVHPPKPTVPYLKYLRQPPVRFFDPQGYPPIAPPWGTLNAISLDTGKLLWQVPLGEYPELVRHGEPPTGSDNYGGPLVTAGGVLFIGATIHDRKFRAFDPTDGRQLWEATLPAAGTATPVTYEVDGRQYVVIAAGGHHAHFGPTPRAAAYVAYALPQFAP